MSHHDDARELVRASQKRAKDSRFRSSILSFRRYSPAVMVFEVFFRHTIGERYFNGRMFLGGLCVLAFIQALSFGSLFGYDIWDTIPDKDFYIATSFDGVIALYILFSLWQFIDQWRLRLKDNSTYSYFMGYSRFYPIGKGMIRFFNWLLSIVTRSRFSPVAGMFICYYLLEPLAALLLTVTGLISTNSMLIGVIGLLGTIDLFKQNYRRLRDSRHQELDRIDSGMLAGHLQQEAQQHRQNKQRQQEKTHQPPMPPISPKTSPQPSKNRPSAVEKALKNLDPKVNNIGEQNNPS